jgi:hypothetical protein
MGNTTSNNMTGGDDSIKEDKNLEDALDYIATYYILTMDFQSLRKLYDVDYCNELVVLTSDIINRYFSDIEITRTADRVEHGSEKEKVLFLKKSDMHHLYDLDPERKKVVCNDIAKFYIKIAHIFAAILMTINPEYVYTDASGKKIKRKLSEKSAIPREARIERVKASFCDSRIAALQGDSMINFEEVKEDEEGEMEIAPKICSVDIYNSRHGEEESGLNDMPGIPELLELYLDTGYDYETGNFKQMSEETRRQFDEDLRRFYSVFTGNEAETMPAEIQQFSDIKLKDYRKTSICSGRSPVLEKRATGSYKNKLFAEYADNLRQMLAAVNEKHQRLLEVINRLFVYVKAPAKEAPAKEAPAKEAEEEVIRVNPDLTDASLQELIAETRSNIVELYLNCETDFSKGVKIYEAIVEAQILETSQRQIDTLQKEIVNLTNPYKAITERT